MIFCLALRRGCALAAIVRIRTDKHAATLIVGDHLVEIDLLRAAKGARGIRQGSTGERQVETMILTGAVCRLR